MSERWIGLLRCPVCRGTLEMTEQLRCRNCGTEFPQVNNVPCLFGPGKEDIWASAQSGLAQILKEHPEIASALEHAGETSLNGADLSAKASMLRLQGRFREAAGLHELAMLRCYPREYIDGLQAQMDFIAESLKGYAGPVLDIASGRGMLISSLLDKTEAALIASDLSPTVLADYQASRWQEHIDSGRLDLMAFDAMNMPFRNGSAMAATTCLGLQNIPGPEAAIRELRRVCGGKLYALCLFFPEDDETNQKAAAKLGLDGAFSLERLLELMKSCGWRITVHEGEWFRMRPTPEGQLVAGMKVDGLPAASTRCRFCTLIGE